MTTQAHAITLTKLNLSAIFGEKDVQTRLKTIADLWVSSPEVFFLDSLGVFKSHEAISGMVGTVQGFGGPDDEFVELKTLKHDEEDDVWVTRVKWGVGSPGGELALTGWDVVTIVGGKIKACYTFLDSK
ncbi:uncharacterized protein K460DRAFT_294206 [Cucurbitaria berberidis CBS 394.84]|uniref:SnoaL-like domain-containing protein n=1 Tax=Cucurbitaria berberidis CBS 394.84 TaxID=1168544 RepID=A0A9P4GA28_9PLEO|nr:uncharacterized protein K460DRAFT_294206 [Cucurbitaria berberidis CBS 394.84]KAF1841785.1 hypothetical protein K460DRAFT_294206 [Cucurbitaria berberidis CBS 394.84]